MVSYTASQKNGAKPTVTPEFLQTARATNPDGKQKVPDSMIAEEIAKKDKDFATMWAKRKQGGDEAAKGLLNYYTYGDPNYGQQPEAQYQFSQNDAMGFFDNPDEILKQLQTQQASQQESGTRIPGAYSIEDQGKAFEENPVLGAIEGAGKVAFNAGAGVFNMGKGLLNAAAHPIQTATGLASAVAGAGELAYEGITGQQVPEYGPEGTQPQQVADTKNQKVAKALWNDLIVKRYGSVDALKKTLFEDPVGVFADALTLIDGAGALKGLSTAGKAGEMAKGSELAIAGAEAGATAKKTGALGAIGKAVKSPLKGAKKIGDTAGALGKEVLGYTTGVGRGAIDETLRTARFGTPEGRAAMSEGAKVGSVREAGVLEDVLSELDKAKEIRSQRYTEELSKLSASRDILDGGPIAQSIGDSLKSFKITGGPGNLNFDMSSLPKGSAAANEIENYVNELSSWGTAAGQTFDGVGLDTLKKRLGEVFPTDPKAKAFATPIQKAITKVLEDGVPGYSKMTSDYAEMSQMLTDVKQTLGVGGKTNRDTAIRKLTNLLKNNNENKESVLRALLKETGNETIIPKMTGVAMAPKTARGVAGVAESVGVGMKLSSLPAYGLGQIAGALAPLIVGSPRLMHEMLKTIGFTQRQIDKIIELGRKVGANKLFSDEAIGIGAQAGRVNDAAQKKMQADKLFEEAPGQK